MQSLNRFLERISLWLAWVAGSIILFGCAVPICLDVVSRALTGSTLVESFEVSGYALAACIGLGMGYTVTTKANIRVDILTAKLPNSLRRPVDLIASCSLAATAVALAYFTFDVLYDSWKLDARSVSTLQVPLVIPQSIWWMGLVWFATVAVLTPLCAAARLMGGDAQAFDAALSTVTLTDELEQIGMTTPGDHQ